MTSILKATAYAAVFISIYNSAQAQTIEVKNISDQCFCIVKYKAPNATRVPTCFKTQAGAIISTPSDIEFGHLGINNFEPTVTLKPENTGQVPVLKNLLTLKGLFVLSLGVKNGRAYGAPAFPSQMEALGNPKNLYALEIAAYIQHNPKAKPSNYALVIPQTSIPNLSTCQYTGPKIGPVENPSVSLKS